MEKQDFVLDVKNLNTSFVSDRKEVRIIKDVSLRLRRGTTLAVVGESGCGKSVTVHSIVKLMAKNAVVKAEHVIYRSAKDGREYRLDEMKPYGPDMRRLRGAEIGMVFQDPMSSLNPVYKVGDQVAEGLIQHTGMKKAEARAHVLDMFKKLGIPDPIRRMNDYPHQFSGGMKQRVVIAMALACNPELLIADEPTTALDVTIQAQVLALMNELKETFNTSMLLITHDLGVVAEVCDRVAIMYAGEIVESGTLEDVYDRTAHPYTVRLFGAVPDLKKEVERLIPIMGLMPDPSSLPKGCSFCPRCANRMNLCHEAAPEAFEVAPGHIVKCHLYSEGVIK